jgi:hypothetical protein
MVLVSAPACGSGIPHRLDPIVFNRKAEHAYRAFQGYGRQYIKKTAAKIKKGA